MPTTSSSPAIHVFVLGREGSLRSKSLQDWILKYQAQVKVSYFTPVGATTGQITSVNKKAKKHFGHPLSAGEVGCSIAHLKMQTKGQAEDLPFVWFFEDDADLLDLRVEQLTEIQVALQFEEVGVGVSLYSRNFSLSLLRPKDVALGRGKFFRFRTGCYPPSTVAYGLNARAMALAATHGLRSGRLPTGKADFPEWASVVTWFVANEINVGHPAEGSTISNRSSNPFGSNFFSPLRILFARSASFCLNARVWNLRSRFLWEFADLYVRSLDRVLVAPPVSRKRFE